MQLRAIAELLWTASAIVLSCNHCSAQNDADFRLVNDYGAFERAVRDGVRHIVLTGHVIEPDSQDNGRNRQHKRTSALQTQVSTRSIVGNCALPPSPKVFQLKEAVPKGACVVQVSSNFLTCGSHNTELWLDLVYVLMSSNSNLHDSSAAVLHKDGALWITNSVFQSTVGDSRGIDVNSYDGGDPRLFVSDTVFADFVTAPAPGVRLTDNTTATIASTSFHRNIVPSTKDPRRARLYGSAAAVYHGASLWLQGGVSVQNNLVQNKKAAAKAFSFANSGNAAAIYSAEPRIVWDWTNAKEVESLPAELRPFPFPRDGPALQRIREEQRGFLQMAGLPVPGVSPLSRRSSNITRDVQAPAHANVVGACVASFVLFVIMVGAWLIFTKTRRKMKTCREQEMAVRDAEARGCCSGERPSPELDAADVPQDMLHDDNEPTSHASSSDGHSLNVLPPSSLFGATESIQNSPMSPLPQIAPLDYTHNHIDHNPTARLRIRTIQRSSPRAETTAPSTGRRLSILDSSNLDHSSHRNFSNLSRTPRISSALTLDINSEHSLPHPEEPGQTLDLELLCKALDNLSISHELFWGEYRILGEGQRRTGDQGVVQFAVHVPQATAVAIKFFMNRCTFDCEEELYTQRSFRKLMPAMWSMESNDTGVVETEEGWRYPPFIVVERGESMEDWLGRMGRMQPEFWTVLVDLAEIVEKVRNLHALGLVHRNLKPGNLLWREKHSWTLIDFGSAALVEEHVHLTYSLAYSPPEVLNKVQDGHVHVHASCSMDMWALGVIAYELAVRGPAFPVSLWPRSAIMEAATGHRPYPWEQKVGIFSKVPELCSLERIVQQCLARNPKKRPTADQFCSVLSTVNAPSNAASVSVRSL